MPNWCGTDVAFCAKRDSGDAPVKLTALRKVMERLLQEDRVIKNQTYNNLWIGKVLAEYGLEPEKISCRSFVSDIEHIEEKGDLQYFVVHIEDAWGPHMGALDALMRTTGCDGLSYVLRAEEPACDVYVNTDSIGLIFPERYVFDYTVHKEGETDLSDCEYFESSSALLSTFKEVTGVDAASYEDAYAHMVRLWDEDPDKYEYLRLAEFKAA